MLGAPTYAAPGAVEPDLGQGIIPYADTTRAKRIPFIGYGPDGKPLP
jgi:hypothetical protein